MNSTQETAEITEAALEVAVTTMFGYSKDFTAEQEARAIELGTRCREWIEGGYILSGRKRDALSSL